MFFISKMDVEVLKWIKYLSLFLYYKISNEIHENQLQRSDNLKDHFNCFKRRWMMTYGMAMASGGRLQSHCGEKMTLFTVAFCQCIKLHPWYSSSVSKQWPINLFFIFKKWTKLQRAKSDEWSRWWAKILLVWAKKNKKHPVFSVSSEPAWDVLLASTAVQIVSSECSPSGHNSQIWYRHSHPGGWIYGAQPDED